MLTSKLACGPMSQEIIEAIFRYSNKTGKQLMLIASRNQIDVESGYVFQTRQYTNYIASMKKMYPLSNIVICRDHCGPGFGGQTEQGLEGTKRTISCDLENGFDLIHIDLCLAKGMSHGDKLQHTLKLMRYAIDINPEVMFEIGTDENVGVAEMDFDRIATDIQMCQRVANPTFYVVQTGSLVYETSNTGSFNTDIVRTMKKTLHRCGTKLKEHNADYLTTKQLNLRKGVVDAVNIAPQLGVVQTSHVLSQALLYGLDTHSFMSSVVLGHKWKKWSDRFENYNLCALIAGHYHFNRVEYQRLVDKLSKHIDVREDIINEITKVVNHYLSSLE